MIVKSTVPVGYTEKVREMFETDTIITNMASYNSIVLLAMI